MVRRRKGGKRKAKGRGKYGKEESREGEKKMEECRETDGKEEKGNGIEPPPPEKSREQLKLQTSNFVDGTAWPCEVLCQADN